MKFSKTQTALLRQNRNRNCKKGCTIQSAPEPERETAQCNINAALKQAIGQIGKSRKYKKTTCEFYVGNLEFTVGDKELFQSLDNSWCLAKFQLERAVVIPHTKGRNRGYGFITLSWPQDAPIDPADICILLSGMIEVNSRPIYLSELRDPTNSQEEQAAATNTWDPDILADIMRTIQMLKRQEGGESG